MTRRALAWSCALLLAGVGCRGDETPESVGRSSSGVGITPGSVDVEARAVEGTSGSPSVNQPTRGAEPDPIAPDARPYGPIPLGPLPEPAPDRMAAGGAVIDDAADAARPDDADAQPPADPGELVIAAAGQVDRAESTAVAAPKIEPTAPIAPGVDGTIGLARPGTLGAGAPADRVALARIDDGRPSSGSRRGRLGPVPGALGLSPTIQLYTFRADLEQGLAAHPRQCRPEYILETIVAVVNRAGGPCEAQRNRIPQAAVDLAYVMCHMPDEVPGCERSYFGTLWVERTPGTHHDYELQAFGRVARTCGSRVEAVTGKTDRRFADRGRALGRLFDLCGQRLTGDATSTSASSPDVESR